MPNQRAVAEPRSYRVAWILGSIVLLFVGLVVTRQTASSFTQYGAGIGLGGAIPMGHEWITRLAALELLGGDPVLPQPDPNDPRKSWTGGKATNTALTDAGAQAEVTRLKKQAHDDSRYRSTYMAVYSAIVGERWVDIAGFNVTKAQIINKIDCWTAVAQEAVDAQYDHFMRRYDDRGAAGGVQAAKLSRQRFIDYYVAAAVAPQTLMAVWDGGASSALTEVDRNYFLFGRAVHLFQDSFSPEHTVRLADDNFRRIRQVKSYLCADGAEQHFHASKTTDAFSYASGDVIWNVGTRITGEGLTEASTWAGYRPSNMKRIALVAVEASKDLWAAFIRTMGVPMAQRRDAALTEATRLADTWLSSSDAEMLAWYDDESHRDATYVIGAGQTGKGKSVADCMGELDLGTRSQQARADTLESWRRVCLFNIQPTPGYADLYDRALRMPFNWEWKHATSWDTVPASWQVPDRATDTGIRVKIKSVANGKYMTAGTDEWVYNRDGQPIEFIMIGSKESAVFRLANANLFLNYRGTSGAVGLYSTPDKGSYKLERVGSAYAIRNINLNEYMYLYNSVSPYITSTGKAQEPTGQWVIEGLP